MIFRNQMYRCRHCGNIVEVVKSGGTPIRCCGEKMGIVTDNTEDAAVEKHVPAVVETEGGIRVSVGEVDHPMEDTHFIEWVEVLTDQAVYRKYLKPGEKPEVFFEGVTEPVTVKAYCNLHGSWKRG